MPRARSLLFLLVCLCIFLSNARGEQITDPNLKFSLTVPDGFVRDETLARSRPDFLYAFRKTEPDDIGEVIILERMNGTIGREKLTLRDMPAGFSGRLFTVRWHDFDVEAVEVPEELGETKMVNYNVQVPLKPKALQLRVLGRRDRSDELLGLTNTLLATLQGDSNWANSASASSVLQSPNYGLVILIVSIICVIGGVVLLWLVRRVTRRGSVLGLAVVIYALSWTIAPGASRQMHAAVGVIRMIGFLGMLIGIYDLIRRPRVAIVASAPPNPAGRAPAPGVTSD